MNPEFSSNNSANIGFRNSPPNTGPPGRTGMYSPINPQLRPRMEQLHSTEPIESNSNQPNYQPRQSNPLQYHQIQQNHQRFPPNLLQQRPQQNMRFPQNDDLIRSPANSNYNNLQYKGPLDGQRIQMTPPIRFPNPQQPVRHMFNNQSGEIPFNQPNLPNQSLKIEPKATPDRLQTNHQNVSPSENYKTGIVSNSSVNSAAKSPDSETNSPNTLRSGQAPNDDKLDVQQANAPNLANAEKNLESAKQKSSPLRREEYKTESKESTESDESESCELKSNEKVQGKDTVTNKKNLKENEIDIMIDDGITSGMVQKNIKFFEQNDTAKKPLRPVTICTEKKEKTAKAPSKNNSLKINSDSGVDETPVIHPNLRSIFQNPLKVAKIPVSKNKKRYMKSKTKRYFGETSKQKYVSEKPAFTQYLKPQHSYHYKSGTKKNENIKTYSPEEELLSFFENTNSWRKLSHYGSKPHENPGKDKVVHKPTTNGDIPTPKKTPSKLQTVSKKNPPASPVKTPLKSPGTPGTPGTKLLPKTPESPAPPTPLIKKVPMNKIQVGAAPSPNLKTIRSKVGSLANTTHKPGGGNIKIESHKIDLSNVQPRTEAKNDQYKPSGGDKKIQQVKLQWSAKSKVGSLENATYKPGGGDKKIESVKLDFKEKAKSKVGSKDNVKHVPGGGNVKIENQKLEFRAQSKVGSLDNVKHKPGGGDIKIFDDKTYLRQVSGNSSEGRASGTQAYRNLSVERELRTRSAPGTPGRKTSIKMKKITMVENLEDVPTIKKVTEVVVTSQTPKANIGMEKSPTKVKVTYSKISALKKNEEATVGLKNTPTKHDAPVLKPDLSEKDMLDDFQTGKQLNRYENKLNFENTAGNRSLKNSESFKQSFESPSLPQGKLNKQEDSGETKFLKSESATKEKIEEIWRDRNVLEKPNLMNYQTLDEQQKELTQSSVLSNQKVGKNHQQYILPNTNIKNGDPTTEMERNFYANQNFQSEQFSFNPAFSQSQLQNSQKTPLQSSVPESFKISSLQKNQFLQNPHK